MASPLRAFASLLAVVRDPSAAWHPSSQILTSHHSIGRAVPGGLASPVRASLAPSMVTETEVYEDLAEQLRAEDVRHKRLYDWLEEGGAELGPIYLAKSKLGYGFGGFASRDIDKGEVIFVVPTKACVNAYDAAGDPDIGDMLANLTMKGQGGATVALAISIAKEWLCDKDQGPRGPFLEMLPWERGGDQEQEHVVWWNWEQMKDLEGNEEALRDAWFVREEVQQAVMLGRALLKEVVREKYKERGENMLKMIAAENDIANAMRGAFVSILTRAFADTMTWDELETRLVPMLDMLQHTNETTENVYYQSVIDDETGEKYVEVVARKDIVEGEELTHCYNFNITESQFLSRHGFVPDSTIPEYVEKLKQNRSFLTNVFLNWPTNNLDINNIR